MKYEFMGFDEVTLNRFWSKVDKRGPDECWEWQGGLHKGYGYIYLSRNKRVYAHRVSCQLNLGDSRLHCLHSCDNPKCVNPNHLSWGTQLENMRDAFIRHSTLKHQTALRCRDIGKRRRRLTAEQAALLRHDALTGLSLSKCATKYGVSKTTAARVCSLQGTYRL
jgi:hypothetical protein